MSDLRFMELSNVELVEVEGGGWNQVGKAFVGTVLIGAGVVASAVPGVGAFGGVGLISLGATGVYSACK